MSYVKEQIFEGVDTASITTFLGLSAIATIVPLFFHIQLVTGPMINAIFILILFFCGIRSAMVVALVPSLMALASGLLPAVLAPAVPFIMISNVIYVVLIDLIYNRMKDSVSGFWIGLGVASFAKFAFLFLSVNVIAKLLIKQEMVSKVAQMMSWPQLATALVGGVIAWGIMKALKRL